MRKLDLWEDLIFAMGDGTLKITQFMIRKNFGKALITIMRDNEVLLSQENIGKAILTGLMNQECLGMTLRFKLRAQ